MMLPRDALQEGLAALATMPRSNRIIDEARLFPGREVRQFIARRYSGAAAYRVIYELQDDTPEGPVALVFHVRHAAARPIGRKEASELEAGS